MGREYGGVRGQIRALERKWTCAGTLFIQAGTVAKRELVAVVCMAWTLPPSGVEQTTLKEMYNLGGKGD